MPQAWCLVLCFFVQEASSSIAEQYTAHEHCNEYSECPDVNRWLQHRVTAEVQEDSRENGLEQLGTSTLLESELDMIESIMRGEVSKESLEVVLARYDEDIQWSEPYKHVRTVYCKDNSSAIEACQDVLPNVGREGHTYLHHIVQNYDNLSAWTVFSQAQDPTIGYRGHRFGGGHIMPGTTFDSYLLPESAGGLPRLEGAVFVITAALHMSNLNHTLRRGFRQAFQKSILHLAGACPQLELGDGWDPWFLLGEHAKFIGGRCGVPADQLPQEFQRYWDQHIKSPRPKDDIVFFAQGARFAASRERIQQRPRSYYQELLKFVSGDSDSCQNYLNEWAWFYLIGSPKQAPCDSSMVLQMARM